MSKARLVITAVITEKRPVSEVARDYGVARSRVYALLARYRAEGEVAFEPRSRRPKTSPNAISGQAAGLIARLRRELAGQGLDAGPHDLLAPGAPPPDHRAGSDRQPVPDPGRPGRPRAAQTAEVLLPAVPGRPAQRVLAVRLHALAAGRRN